MWGTTHSMVIVNSFTNCNCSSDDSSILVSIYDGKLYDYIRTLLFRFCWKSSMYSHHCCHRGQSLPTTPILSPSSQSQLSQCTTEEHLSLSFTPLKWTGPAHSPTASSPARQGQMKRKNRNLTVNAERVSAAMEMHLLYNQLLQAVETLNKVFSCTLLKIRGMQYSPVKFTGAPDAQCL